jgi:hypothetical protein
LGDLRNQLAGTGAHFNLAGLDDSSRKLIQYLQQILSPDNYAIATCQRVNL